MAGGHLLRRSHGGEILLAVSNDGARSFAPPCCWRGPRIGACARSRSVFCPTISLQIEHLAPSPLGAWVQGEADVLSTTRTMVFAQGPGDGRRRADRPAPTAS